MNRSIDPPAQPWDEGHIFLKHVDKEGVVYYTEHHCWHVANFMSMCVKAEADVGTTCLRVPRAEFEKATARRKS